MILCFIIQLEKRFKEKNEKRKCKISHRTTDIKEMIRRMLFNLHNTKNRRY